MNRHIYIPLLFFSVVSCNFKDEVQPEAIARVADSFLYKDAIADLVPAGISKQDSVLMVRNYINRWASQKLLMNAAEINLNEAAKKDLNVLVAQYKIDLYTTAYIEEIVKRSVDTIVSEAELKSDYDANKENFKSTGTLLRLRYIQVPKEHPGLEQIRSKFLDFRKSERLFWKTHQPQFRSSALNDSVWVEMNEVYKRIPFITPDNRNTYIAPGMSFQKELLQDVFLVKVLDVINKNEICPFDYLKPTLKQLILNRRKLELIKKFEKEITDDAIKNDKYEIYK